MATQVDVPGMGITLFSPVLAHSLEPGDLIQYGSDTNRVLRVERGRSTGLLYAWVGPKKNHALLVNEPILRAVGARAGGVI